MKTTLRLLGFLVAVGGMATASTLTISIAEDTYIATSTGVAVDNTWSVTGGYYYVGNGLDYASISTNFVGVGSIAFPYGGIPAYNGYTAGTTDFFNANTLGIEGQNVFLFATNGVDFVLLEDTGTQFLLETAIPNTNTTVLNESLRGNFTVHAGTNNGLAIEAVAGIPEPSVMLLGGLGVLGLVRRRRA